MSFKTVYQCAVEYLQIMDENGHVDEKLVEGLLSDEEIGSLYQQMILCREFDEAAFKLQRSGRMGTFPQNKGEEAATLGAARALRKGIDWIVPYYRENSALFLHGLPLHHVLLHWMGDERGNAIARKYAISPMTVAIGAQTPQAVGVAWAFKLRKEDRVVLCFCGDGATSTGDWHEAMNLAAVMKVPCIFCCVNNQWAISVPRSRQCAATTLAQKGAGYGMPAVQVDGNDLLAVYKAHRDAVERARKGEGPSFIEALTYRLGDHTTADDARRYREEEELQEAMRRDPLVRVRKYLEARSLWDEERETRAWEVARKSVRDVIEAALSLEKPAATDLFDYTFAKLPAELERQRRTMRTDSLGQDPEQIGLQSRPQKAEAVREETCPS